jgi:hypothetical protein
MGLLHGIYGYYGMNNACLGNNTPPMYVHVIVHLKHAYVTDMCTLIGCACMCLLPVCAYFAVPLLVPSWTRQLFLIVHTQHMVVSAKGFSVQSRRVGLQLRVFIES